MESPPDVLAWCDIMEYIIRKNQQERINY